MSLLLWIITYSFQNSNSSFRCGSSTGQRTRWWRRSPTVSVSGCSWQKGEFSLLKCEQSFSVRDLPDKYLACWQALLSWYLSLPQDIQRWCGWDRDIKFGLKYLRELFSNFAASWRSFNCQKSWILRFISFLNSCFSGGCAKSWRGCGRLYWKQSFLICINQDLAESGHIELFCAIDLWNS